MTTVESRLDPNRDYDNSVRDALSQARTNVEDLRRGRTRDRINVIDSIGLTISEVQRWHQVEERLESLGSLSIPEYRQEGEGSRGPGPDSSQGRDSRERAAFQNHIRNHLERGELTPENLRAFGNPSLHDGEIIVALDTYHERQLNILENRLNPTARSDPGLQAELADARTNLANLRGIGGGMASSDNRINYPPRSINDAISAIQLWHEAERDLEEIGMLTEE